VRFRTAVPGYAVQKVKSTIQHYRRLLSHFFDDPVTVERVNNLIRDLQQRKEAMHC
jgi:hypothetical protein